MCLCVYACERTHNTTRHALNLKHCILTTDLKCCIPFRCSFQKPEEPILNIVRWKTFFPPFLFSSPISISNGWGFPLLFQPVMKEQKPFCLFTHFEQNALKLLCQHVLLSSAFSRKILFQPDHIYQNIKPTLKHGFAWSAALRQIMTDSENK